MHFYHTHPYNLFLFPSPTHWIPSFSLLVLLLHSHLYLLFFYDLVNSIRAASNILVEGLFRRACTLFCGCNNGENCILVLNAVLSTIPKWCNQPRSQSKYNREENKVEYTIFGGKLTRTGNHQVAQNKSESQEQIWHTFLICEIQIFRRGQLGKSKETEWRCPERQERNGEGKSDESAYMNVCNSLFGTFSLCQ